MQPLPLPRQPPCAVPWGGQGPGLFSRELPLLLFLLRDPASSSGCDNVGAASLCGGPESWCALVSSHILGGRLLRPTAVGSRGHEGSGMTGLWSPHLVAWAPVRWHWAVLVPEMLCSSIASCCHAGPAARFLQLSIFCRKLTAGNLSCPGCRGFFSSPHSCGMWLARPPSPEEASRLLLSTFLAGAGLPCPGRNGSVPWVSHGHGGPFPGCCSRTVRRSHPSAAGEGPMSWPWAGRPGWPCSSQGLDQVSSLGRL